MRLFDGHNDTLLKIAMCDPDDGWSFGRRNGDGALDLVRAAEGGLAGGFFAIMAPPETGDDMFGRSKMVRTDEGYEKPMAPEIPHRVARDFADEVFSLAKALEEAHEDRFFIATDYRQLVDGMNAGKLAAVLHFEGAEPIDEKLENLEGWYQRGLRSVGLVWSRPNRFGHGVPFRYPSSPDTGEGLTDAGEQLVDACNELGIIIDCAHLNEKGFWDVADRSDAPLVVTHACCHAIAPSARNLTDAQIDAVGETGGVVGINFFVGDLRDDATFDRDTPLSQIVRHIDYVVDRVGVDHVAFGSDFDGARMPRELDDASKLPRLIEALQQAGYGSEEVGKIAGGNWLRVVREVWG